MKTIKWGQERGSQQCYRSPLVRDVAQVKAELSQLSADVRSIHGAFKSFSDVTTKTLVPLLGMVFKFGKKDKY